MKNETLEMIIEELASALATERWISKSLREDNRKLKEELEDLDIKLKDLQQATETTEKIHNEV